VKQACRIACQVLKGLEFAHSLGIVHRDIKPENILIGKTPDGKLIAKISDFGLAKNIQSMGLSNLTFSGEMRGTIPFMPPEQMIDFKTVKPSADLYATAATLYFLISGTYVFDSDDSSPDMIQLLMDHKIVPLADRRGDVPEELSELIQQCLARDPADRLPTATAMRNALKAFA
jgi:serine/threonine-protein kinase